MKIPRPFGIAALFGAVWALLSYSKGIRDPETLVIGFLAFLVVGPLLAWLLGLVLRVWRGRS